MGGELCQAALCAVTLRRTLCHTATEPPHGELASLDWIAWRMLEQLYISFPPPPPPKKNALFFPNHLELITRTVDPLQ